MGQIRALTGTAFRYSIWVSREVYGIQEINQLVNIINDDQLCSELQATGMHTYISGFRPQACNH